MKQTKRLLASFLTLCLLLGLMPTTAWAASALEITQQPTADNNYTVKATCEGAITNTVTILSQEEQATADWLADSAHQLTLGPTTVTADNAKDILSDGKASFALVDGMPTLTLNGVKVTEGIEQAGGTIGLTCSDALTIVLAEGSDNTITLTDDMSMGIVIGAQGDGSADPVFLTVTGKGTLTVDVTGSSSICMGVSTKRGVQVTGGAELTVTASAPTGPQCFGLFIQEEDLQVSGEAKLTVTASAPTGSECLGLCIQEGDLQVSGGGVVRLSGTGAAAAFGGTAPQIPLEEGYSIRGSTTANDFDSLTDVELVESIIMIGDAPAQSVVIAPAEPAHSHPVCGASCSHTESHEDVEWTPLTQADFNNKTNGVTYTYNDWNSKYYTLAAGNYYLAENITIDAYVRILANTTVNLCLNGKKLSDNQYSSIPNYFLEVGGTLTLCSCADEGGEVETKSATTCIQISNSKVTVNLYNVKVIGKSSGINNNGTLTVSGGEVKGGQYRGISNVGDNAKLTLIGNPKISGVTEDLQLKTADGTTLENAQVDATRYTGGTLKVKEFDQWGALTDEKIGKYAIKGGEGKFTLTNTCYKYEYESGGMVICGNHKWATTWSSDGNCHWHNCNNTGCPIADNTQKDGYAAHIKTWVKTDTTQHWETCATCGWTGEKTAHVYDGDTDTTCDICNYTRTIGAINGKVDVGENAPNVDVDEEDLKKLAGTPQTGETVTVTLTVEKKAENAAEGAAEIKNMATGKRVDFLDLSLVKTVTGGSSPGSTTITNAAKVLEIVVSYDFSGKKDVTVYRKHGSDAAIELSKLTAKPGADAMVDGFFFADSAGGKLYIYAAKFSTYAIGYTPEGGGNSGGSGGSGSGGWSGGGSSSGSGGSVTDKPAPGEVSSCLRDKTCPVWSYTDASVSAWYHDGIHYCVQNGLMVGTDSTHFSPGTTASRAMIAAILWRLEGEPKAGAVQPFSDVADDRWYTQAIAWAAETGVVKGYGEGRFGPNDPITREQLASLLWRYAGSPAAADLPLSFTDAGEASGYAQDALRWAVDQGILTGKGGGVLDPRGMATRAEAAQMLMRFCLSRK